jgi:acetyl esterase/lipase
MSSKLRILGIAVAMLSSAACSFAAAADGPGVRKSTFACKTPGDLQIRADVHGPDIQRTLPVVVNIRGGELLKMGRGSMPRPTEVLLRSGFMVVSVGCRPAGERKLPEIVRDVVDACRGVRRDDPRLFGVDPGRLAVFGASAGGSSVFSGSLS